MIRLPEDEKKIDSPATTPSSGQPFASGSSTSTVSSPPLLLNDSLNGQLGAAETNPLIDLGSSTSQNIDLGPPPEFTPYEAEHFEVGYSNIVSHDPHLNSDGSF